MVPLRRNGSLNSELSDLPAINLCEMCQRFMNLSPEGVMKDIEVTQLMKSVHQTN